MPWIKRQCAFRHDHQVFTQEAENSCGPSCMMMAYQRIWGRKFEQPLSYEAYTKYGGGGNYDGSNYSYTNHLAAAMRKFVDGKTKDHAAHAPTQIADRILTSLFVVGKPIIALTDWSLGGGHFVLIDQASKLAGDYYICVCDPWDGKVRSQKIVPGQTVRYSANYPKVTKQGYEYAAAPNSGVFTKWTVEIGMPARCSLN